MGGYFITQGLDIFKEFYFNHQPGMAFLSAFVHFASHPDSIPELILRHRQIMFVISFVLTVLLYLRFGYKVIVVSLLFEFVKFYVFADRFLAEGIVGYLIVYQAGTIYERLIHKKSNSFDIVTMPLISWAIVILREPYLFATLLLFAVYLIPFYKKERNIFFVSFFTFIIPSLLVFILNSPFDYFYNVVTVNKSILASDALNQNVFIKLIKISLYPVYFIVSPEPWTILRSYISLLSILYIACSIYVVRILKEWKLVFFASIILILVNLRPSPANVQFYEAFNLSVWLLTLIFTTIFLWSIILKHSKKVGIFILCTFVFTLLSLVLNKNYFAYEKINTHEEFFTNYSHIMDVGTKIRNLSNKNDTLFIDGYDDLILWESKLQSGYKYTWYTSFMPRLARYTKARDEMFATHPPDFYYGECFDPKNIPTGRTTKILTQDYINISPPKERGCIFIHNNKLKELTDAQKETLRGTKYKLPH